MKRIINFLAIQAKEESLIIRQKVKAIIVTDLIAMLLVLMNILFVSIITGSFSVSKFHVHFILLGVGTLNLIIIRFYKYSFSGNFFATSILLTEILAVAFLKQSPDSFMPYIASYFIQYIQYDWFYNGTIFYI